MAQPFVIYQGQVEPSIPQIITYGGGKIFDLTSCTVAFSMRPSGSSVLTVDHAAVSIVLPAVNGQVQFDWTAGQTAVAGPYRGWWTVTLPNGKPQDTPEFEIEVASHATAGTRALITLDELIDHMRLGNPVRTVKENDYQTLRSKILAASTKAESYTNHRFAAETASTHTFPYDGNVVMSLNPWDLRTLTQIQIDTDFAPYTMSASEYRLEPRNTPYGVYTHVDLMPYNDRIAGGRNWWAQGGSLASVGTFGREVQITGDWGWLTVPEDIKEGVKILASRLFNNPFGAQIVRTANVEYQFARGGANTGAGDDLPDDVKSLWTPYIRAAA